jgi:hypothetical protein
MGDAESKPDEPAEALGPATAKINFPASHVAASGRLGKHVTEFMRRRNEDSGIAVGEDWGLDFAAHLA